MIDKQKTVPTSGIIILFLVLLNAIALKEGYTDNEKWYSVLLVTFPLLILAILDTRQKKGAKLGGFAPNTGEGGISEYHLKGGDLIWQIGTGYFGCRDEKGRFHSLAFRKKALLPQVKMIELKLSKGAKPGHGGIVPAAKNTLEIAAIRQVKAGITIHSPAGHAEFDTAEGMVQFLQLLRELSEGKPFGFKICIGDKQ